MRFSQRIGKTPVKTVLQVELIDEDLLNSLWNVFIDNFFEKLEEASVKTDVCEIIWKEFYKNRIDEIPYHNDSCVAYFKQWFFNATWYQVYDFIEFIAEIDFIAKTGFSKLCNYVLEREVSGYRIMNGKVVQITSEEEIQEIEDATTNAIHWKSVNTHLKTALDLLADRKTPNYRNSIKESISAVESLCKIITKDDNATLGKALLEIEKSHNIHKALKKAFSAIYGYTSDSGGIRHSLLESDLNVDFEEAKFMLVSCSAFINYLKAKMKT